MACDLATLEDLATSIEVDLSARGVNTTRALSQEGRRTDESVLRERLWRKCLQPGARKKKVPLVVVTIGGSMTSGSMNCIGTANLCAGKWANAKQAWPRQLEEKLTRSLPGCQTVVYPRVFGARTITTVLYGEKFIKGGEDLLIEDFSVNDHRGRPVVNGKLNRTHDLKITLGGHETLARQAVTHGVQLALMEGFTQYLRGAVEGGRIRCQPDDDFVHTASERGRIRTHTTSTLVHAIAGPPARRSPRKVEPISSSCIFV